MPLILFVKNYSEALDIKDLIYKELYVGGCSVEPYELLRNPLSDEELINKVQYITSKLDGALHGTINTTIYTPKPEQAGSFTIRDIKNKFTIKDLIKKEPKSGFDFSIIYYETLV